MREPGGFGGRLSACLAPRRARRTSRAGGRPPPPRRARTPRRLAPRPASTSARSAATVVSASPWSSTGRPGGLVETPREVPHPARPVPSVPSAFTGWPTTTRITSRSFAARGDGGRGLRVARARDDAHGDDDAAGLVRDGEADPLLAEIDREDAHDPNRRRPPRRSPLRLQFRPWPVRTPAPASGAHHHERRLHPLRRAHAGRHVSRRALASLGLAPRRRRDQGRARSRGSPPGFGRPGLDGQRPAGRPGPGARAAGRARGRPAAVRRLHHGPQGLRLGHAGGDGRRERAARRRVRRGRRRRHGVHVERARTSFRRAAPASAWATARFSTR